ncbi:MAG: hypothetical protein ACXAEN_25370 [Candidatus Thorarchaeota archaeon]|jgi:hypothetical protein
MSINKPILCLDFDGVLHSYASGWQGADVIPDDPVSGAQDFVKRAQEHFEIVIHSSRCGQPGAEDAIVEWLMKHDFPSGISVSVTKPPAHLTIDDRGWQFTGIWPDIEELVRFKTWRRLRELLEQYS